MLSLGIYSYGLSALVFIAVFFLIIFRWRGRLASLELALAMFAGSVWAVVSAYSAYEGYVVSIWSVSIEVLRYLIWGHFLLKLLASFSEINTSWYRILERLVYGVPVLLLALLLFVSTSDVEAGRFLGFDLRTMGHLILSLLGLMLIEQLFRLGGDQRWAFKFLFLGFGGVYLFDFYMYSEALLFHALDVDDWISRGFIIAIAICIATIGINRLPMASIRLTLSRPVVFYTAGLVIAGIYLLVVAVSGYYLKVFGGDWGVIARNTFVFAALLFLFALIVSGEMRGRLRVYIDKHFLNYKYDYREEWLRLIRQLSSEQELGRLEEQSVKVLADIMDSPSGILWVKKNSESFYPVAQLGFSELQGLTVSTSSPMARFLEQWQWVINTDEYQKEPELYQGLTLPDWVENSNNIQLIIPLMLQVRLYGFVVLSRPRAEKEFNWEDIDLLRTAGRQVAIHLSQARSNLALVEARQFEAFNRLSAYVMHDLKNLMTQLGLVVKNAEKHKSNPAFVDDAISTVENAVGRMNRLLAQLKSGIMTVEKVATITIDEVLAQVIKDKSRQLPIPEIVRSVDGVINADKDRLVSVVGHIVQNAQDATGPNGTIKIYASMDQESIIVEIVDNGVGMDNEFVTTRLFKPFDSTKGLTGMGIGAHEVRQFIEELGGSVKVDSHPGVGTTFSLVIPRRQLVLS